MNSKNPRGQKRNEWQRKLRLPNVTRKAGAGRRAGFFKLGGKCTTHRCVTFFLESWSMCNKSYNTAIVV